MFKALFQKQISHILQKRAGIQVAGKVAVITGASSGMGAVWARKLATDGARVVLLARSERVETLAEELRANGLDATAMRVDVSNNEAIHKAASEILDSHHRIDLVINNAGTVQGGAFDDVPIEKSANVLDVNLKGAMYVAHAFLPALSQNEQGAMLFVASASAFLGVPYMAAYTASKWGLLGLAESLRLEMKAEGHNVQISSFCPGYVDTGMFEGAKAPLFTPFLTPESAVEMAYKPFLRGQTLIAGPGLVKITPTMRALLPTSMFDAISSLSGATLSMKKWLGHNSVDGKPAEVAQTPNTDTTPAKPVAADSDAEKSAN